MFGGLCLYLDHLRKKTKMSAAAAAATTKSSITDLMKSNPAFHRLLVTYRDSAANPLVRFDALYKLEEFKRFLTAEGIKALDDFFESGEASWLTTSAEVETQAKIFSTITKMGSQLPMKHCHHCQKSCSMGSKCDKSGQYHM
jgi:hypothetical protein